MMQISIFTYVFRPPGAVVPGSLTADVSFLFFFLPRNLRAPSADRRETLPRDRKALTLGSAPNFSSPLCYFILAKFQQFSKML